MKCPHCLVEANFNFSERFIFDNETYGYSISYSVCPNDSCKNLVAYLNEGQISHTQAGPFYHPSSLMKKRLINPKGISRNPVPESVPEDIKQVYLEAALVLADSPQASAALSRRCLQHLLRDHVGVKNGDLYDEIEEALAKGGIPSYISEELHSIRQIGNFGAHPNKSKNTGEVIPVEPGEAENNLDVLDSLFDFYFVVPEKTKQRKDALKAKLDETRKKSN